MLSHFPANKNTFLLIRIVSWKLTLHIHFFVIILDFFTAISGEISRTSRSFPRSQNKIPPWPRYPRKLNSTSKFSLWYTLLILTSRNIHSFHILLIIDVMKDHEAYFYCYNPVTIIFVFIVTNTANHIFFLQINGIGLSEVCATILDD